MSDVAKAISHRRDAESAEVFYKEIFSLRALRLCGELYKIIEFLDLSHFYPPIFF